MNKVADTLTRAPVAMMIVVLLLTILAASALVDPTDGIRIRIDPSIDRLLPENDENYKYYNEMQSLFGDDGAIIAAVAVDDAFDPAVAKRLADVTATLRELPDVRDVLSLAVAPAARGSDLELEIRPVTDMLQRYPSEASTFRQQVLGDPLYRGTIVAPDARTASFIVLPRSMSDQELMESGVIEQIRRVVADTGEFNEVWVTGTPVIKVATTEVLVREMARTLPAIIGLVALFLAAAFRSGRAVMLAIATIALALIWTLGMLAWLDIPLNLVTSIVPPLIITLGLAYAMHVLSEYFSVAVGSDTACVRATLGKVAVPLLITGLTTSAGFLALYINPLPAIREFAWVSTLGVLFTVALSLTFLPASLQLIGCRDRPRPPGERLFDWLARRLAAFDVRHRKVVLVAAGLLFLVSFAGMTQIEVGSENVGSFAEDSVVRRDYTAINDRLGGANVFSIVIDGQVKDAFVNPENLQAISNLQAWLDTQPEIGGSTSMADQVRGINRALNDGDPAYSFIPDSSTVIKQLLVFGGGDELRAVVDKRFKIARISVRARVEDTRSVAQLVERIQVELSQLPSPLVGRVTGGSILIMETVDDIARGQATSIGAALLVVFVMLSLLFTSKRIGFLAMLPNVLPVMVYFGALGISGITLNPTTSLIACIVLGIAVDDTIHFLARFNADARDQASEEKAVYSALRAVLRPVTFTSVALCVGFLVLTGSELNNQVQFGALAAFTMAVAWLVDVTFTPALGSGIKIVTLWDILRLDLGDDPQSSMPLFAGLSNRQARIFALMSNILNLRSGTRVITEGEDAGDIYVLVDGSMKVWVERDGERRVLNELTRGATLGEVGYFDQKRTANVDASTHARLLRFNSADLERLRRRYPKIAAIVYRNLNLIQAERLARTTAMVR